MKNISNKDVGMSKPKKHVNKVRWDPKLNKPLSYNPTYISTSLFYWKCYLLFDNNDEDFALPGSLPY